MALTPRWAMTSLSLEAEAYRMTSIPPSGAPLFTGTLERGRSQRFTRKALYLYVAKPKNVVVKLNGNPGLLSRGGELLVPAASVG